MENQVGHGASRPIPINDGNIVNVQVSKLIYCKASFSILAGDELIMAPGKDGGESLNGNKLETLSCLSDCKNRCEFHPECNGFVYNNDDNTCQLKRLRNATDTFNLKQLDNFKTT